MKIATTTSPQRARLEVVIADIRAAGASAFAPVLVTSGKCAASPLLLKARAALEGVSPVMAQHAVAAIKAVVGGDVAWLDYTDEMVTDVLEDMGRRDRIAAREAQRLAETDAKVASAAVLYALTVAGDPMSPAELRLRTKLSHVAVTLGLTELVKLRKVEERPRVSPPHFQLAGT